MPNKKKKVVSKSKTRKIRKLKAAKVKIDKKLVIKALGLIRPSLQAHGGNVSLVKIDDQKGIVWVKLQGMCAGCPMSQVTLKDGIEDFMKKEIKGVKKVEAI